MPNDVKRFCPNPKCPNHDIHQVGETRWYSPHGWYHCQSGAGKPIRRFRCDTCGKTFSETYFSRSWHLQRRDIDEIELLFDWCRGLSVAQLAKTFGCSPRTIENRIVRMQRLAQNHDIVFDVAYGNPMGV